MSSRSLVLALSLLVVVEACNTSDHARVGPEPAELSMAAVRPIGRGVAVIEIPQCVADCPDSTLVQLVVQNSPTITRSYRTTPVSDTLALSQGTDGYVVSVSITPLRSKHSAFFIVAR